MLVNDNAKIVSFLDKGIIGSTFLFALASLTSKGLSSVGVGFACLLWLVRIAITKNYNFTKVELNKAILSFTVSLLISGLDVRKIIFLDEVEKILLAILFYFAIVNTIDNLELIKKLTFVALISMLISNIYGIYQEFIVGVDRVNAFSIALSYGGLISIFLMFTIAYLLWSDIELKCKLTLLMMTVIMGMNLLFTRSRGAWIGFISGSFSLVWLRDKKWIFALACLLIVLSLFLPQNFINRFKSSINITTNRSNLGRIALWKGSWLMYRDHPINGIGMGHFKKKYFEEYEQPNTTNAAHAHNNFLHFLATGGTIGILAFCWLTFKIFQILYREYQEFKFKSKWGLFILASLAGLVAFTVQGLTEFSFGDTESVRFFWFLIALNMVLIKQFRQKENMA